ncbi:MAG TPA: hypothetical protein PKL78_07635 [Anaerolineales bacterium]|nr:hypothetical protein [Anaerolineales bacterium]
MHRHKRFRYGPPLFRRRHRFGGWIWWALLGFLFFGGNGHWWPGILVLIGLFVLFGSLFREERPSEPPPAPIDPFDPKPFAPPPAPKPAPPPPAEPYHRADLLPATCPNCGGPVRSGEVKWTSSHSAACSYCGSNIEAKKN